MQDALAPNSSNPGNVAMNEIDNHANTICASPNWKLLELSGEYCSISPFSADSRPKPEFPIAKVATVYTCPDSGDSLVLVSDQLLWLGDELHCLFINPHQIRSHGYGVCDDPWDPHRPLGIDLESIFIPLTVSGPNLSFKTRVPCLWEMDSLLIIEIISPTWNPADLQMPGPQSTPTHAVDCVSRINRVAGYMVHLNSTSVGNLTPS